MFAEVFLIGLAQALATDLVKGLGSRIAKGFRDPEIDRALGEALGDALAASLPHALPGSGETDDADIGGGERRSAGRLCGS